MNDLLRNIIARQKLELEAIKASSLIERAQLKNLKESLKSNLIKVILGPRRAGKSTLALQALKNKKFAYINFEDESFPLIDDGELIINALHEVYGKVDYYYFDEIQNFNRWEQFLNRQHRVGRNLIVTGSNANLLSEELVSSLTGRHIEIELLPFSYKEIHDNNLVSFEEYLVMGGFPEVVLNNGNFRAYLSALWEAVTLKDIAKRKKIRNIVALSNVLSLMLSSVTSRYSVESVVRALNKEVSAPTVKNFLKYCAEAYLLSELTKYDFKPRTRIKSDRKCYVVDNGFYSAKNIGFSGSPGILLENAVFNDLRIRGYKANISLFYYVTSSGYEVDFILRSGHKNIEAIQVCYSLTSLKTKERELRALVETAKELNIEKLTIVSFSEDKIEKYEKSTIEIIPAHRWFVEK